MPTVFGRSNGFVLYVLAALTLAAAALALTVGPVAVDWSHLFAGTLEPFENTVLTQIRLPRVVLALLVGAALAQAGAALQGLVRNPLADPGLVGISSGAALAAVAVLVLGHEWADESWQPGPYALPLASFAGGAAACWMVVRVAEVDGYTRAATLLLAGLALNAIAGAGIGLLTHIAGDLALRMLTFWMFGSLGKAAWPEIAVAAPLLLIPLLLIPRRAAALNALLLGEAEAGHLGVNVERLKRELIVLIVLGVGVSVALSGIVAFVGLVVPHLVRLWAGPDHRLLLPASALGGALLLTLADTAARSLLAPMELPVGVLTALIGGPFFLALLLRLRRDAEWL